LQKKVYEAITLLKIISNQLEYSLANKVQ